MLPIERCHAHQSQSIWDSAPTDRAISQHPGIDTVGFPHLGQFLACLLKPQLIAQGFGFIPLHDLKGCKFPQLRIKPVLADLQRGEAPIPATFAPFRAGFDILDHEDRDGEDVAQEPYNPQFPLPARSGGRWQCSLALLAVLAWLTTGGVPMAASPAHAGTHFLCVLDSISGLCLDIEIGMCRCCDTVALALGTRVNTHGDELQNTG